MIEEVMIEEDMAVAEINKNRRNTETVLQFLKQSLITLETEDTKLILDKVYQELDNAISQLYY